MAADDRRVIETGEPISTEYEMAIGGDTRTYLAVKFAIPAPSGGEVTIAGISTDITEQKRALDAATRGVPAEVRVRGQHEPRDPHAR